MAVVEWGQLYLAGWYFSYTCCLLVSAAIFAQKTFVIFSPFPCVVLALERVFPGSCPWYVGPPSSLSISLALSTHSVTQVLELNVHLECSQLPLDWVTVMEVLHRYWTIKPAVTKHRAAEQRLSQSDNSLDAFPHYIARPSHNQDPHTIRHAAVPSCIYTIQCMLAAYPYMSIAS